MNPEYSLEGLMVKLKLQYFGYLMQRRELDKTERLTHTQLIYNVVMVSDAQQSESAMHIHTLEAAPPIL